MAEVEEWRPVLGFESQYEVSSLGRVRSLERFRRGPYGSRVRVVARVLRQVNSGAGYLGVSLGKGKRALVHRLVAQAFIDNPNALPEVNHKNGVKTHNAVTNLEWMSHVENGRHASRMGLLATGDRHGSRTRRRQEIR